MYVNEDPKRHDQLERWLANEIVRIVRSKLDSSGIASGLIPELTRDIAVDLADLWDGCHGVAVNEEFMSPFLVFAAHNDDEEVVVSSYDHFGSFLHEHVAAAADEIAAR